MAFYVDEGEVWKCLKHPSKRRRSGICPVCLRERLASLCPDCAHSRPCSCRAITTSSSSSSSSSFSRFSISGGEIPGARIGAVGRVSNLIGSEPAFRRSRSVALPLLRSNLNQEKREDIGSHSSRMKTPSFWSLFKASNKSRRGETAGERTEKSKEDDEKRRMMMRKSRSVAVVTSDTGAGEVKSSPATAKWRGWYFPSPIKAFRHSRASKLVFQEGSPLYRG